MAQWNKETLFKNNLFHLIFQKKKCTTIIHFIITKEKTWLTELLLWFVFQNECRGTSVGVQVWMTDLYSGPRAVVLGDAKSVYTGGTLGEGPALRHTTTTA